MKCFAQGHNGSMIFKLRLNYLVFNRRISHQRSYYATSGDFYSSIRNRAGYLWEPGEWYTIQNDSQILDTIRYFAVGCVISVASRNLAMFALWLCYQVLVFLVKIYNQNVSKHLPLEMTVLENCYTFWHFFRYICGLSSLESHWCCCTNFRGEYQN